MKKSTAIIIFLALLGFVCGCESREAAKKVSLDKRAPEEEVTASRADARSLKFGFDLRLEPKEDVKLYLPFLRYLERNTGNKFSLKFTEKYEDTVENLGKGITDFAALGPVNCVLAEKRYGSRCLVVGLNDSGRPEYHAVIITRTDSSISTLKDLKGKSFAFGDKYSTQGYLIPRKMLEDAGVLITDFKSYAFTGSHALTARAVLNGEYDAGALEDTMAKRLAAEGKIKILAISKPYPSSLICVNRGVHFPIVMSVKNALLSFDPKGKDSRTLVDWYKTEMPGGFTEYRPASLEEIGVLAV
ncbi:MAG: phosphate/phosphite/phosphonate ABC transporter substrate-binding protein, partial [Nitrospiraceae bacterium]|nr:phosphate/phosphite/phosphonate ABC transporter substrate-binding protein [Nitrospiraceae bacterium]